MGLPVATALEDVFEADQHIDYAPCGVAAQLLERLVEEQYGEGRIDEAG